MTASIAYAAPLYQGFTKSSFLQPTSNPRSQANGGTQRPFTYLLRTFVPKLRIHGLDETLIRKLISENPRRAFGLAPGGK